MKRLTFYSTSFFLFTFLMVSCNLFDKNKDDPGSVPNLNNIVTGSSVEVANSPVGLTGANIKISKPDTPVDGMEITIPANSFTSVQTVTVSYSEIKSHKFGQYFNPISPMITIACDGGYSNTIMSVTIPVKVPEGQIAIGFFLDDVTGKLEGIPFESVTSNSITLLTRHFLSGNKLKSGDLTLKSASAETNRGANIIISSISESVLNLQPIIASGFKPGTDDWEFSNRGSYLVPGGHCAGQNMAAMWYYFEKKAIDGNLFNKFSDNPKLWQDNARGYRFCSVIHNDLDWAGTVTTLFDKYIDKNQELDRLKLLTIAGTMLVTGEPQGMGIYRPIVKDDGTPGFAGHDLICYQVSVSSGKLYISDPNTPGTGQSIEFTNNKFLPYLAKINAEEVSESYPFVTYYAKTAYIEWNKIGSRYAQLSDNTIGTVAPNTFPAYTIWNKDGAGSELKDGAIVTKDSLVTTAICPDSEVFYNVQNQKLIGMNVYDATGNRIDIALNKYTFLVKLKPGLNKLGYYVIGWRKSSKYDDGTYKNKFVDFKWLNVFYSKLEIDPSPILGEPQKDIVITAKSYGTAPKNAKYVWNFGDGTKEVTVLNDSLITHSFDKKGNYQVDLKLYDNSTGKLVSSAKATANIDVSLFAMTEWRSFLAGGQSESLVFSLTFYSVYMGIDSDYHYLLMSAGTYTTNGNTAKLTAAGNTKSDNVTINGNELTWNKVTYTKVN